MYKKLGKVAFFLVFSLGLVSFGTKVQAQTNSISYNKTNLLSANTAMITSPQLNKDYVGDGYVQVRYSNSSDKRMKVSVKKDDKVYYYDFDGKGQYENYPLQMGNGKYIVTLLQNTQGKEYVEVENWNIDAKIKEIDSVYSISNKIVNFDKASETISKAAELTKGIGSDDKKVEVIYNYLISNVKYDYDKLNAVQAGYLSDIDSTVNSGKGICYDFSATFAGMLRSVGVPTKVVMGYSNNTKGYHAWNEVYLNRKWLVVDTSADSQAKEAGAKFSMYKVSDNYQKEKEY
ncbi:MAG: transglutaminase domain-containing protein [Clostridiaceae bacterium]|nr:transglutaminase domain-containing protein [Clostridiaceae bacterium]